MSRSQRMKRPVDSLTILFCVPGHKASKRFSKRADGQLEIHPYNAGKSFGFTQWPVNNVIELSATLLAIEDRPETFVIRGAALPHIEKQAVAHRRNENFQTPAEGRRWMLIDIDKVKLPEGLSLKKDIAEVLRYIVSLLPNELHDVSFHWQLSSSAGMKEAGVESMHLWFWLSEPTTDEDLKRWGKAANAAVGFTVVDTTLFQHVQVHYTARPMFDGVADPFPQRSGLHHGQHQSATLNIPPVPLSASAIRQSSGAIATTSVGFEAKLAAIGDHPGGEGFRGAILRASASYVAEHGIDEDTRLWLAETIRARALQADRSPGRTDAEIEDKADLESILKQIDGAAKKFGPIDPTRRRAKLGTSEPAHYSAKRLSAEEASAQLQQAVASFFEC